MSVDPTDPGATQLASVSLTRRQLTALTAVVSGHRAAVRLDQLGEGWVRVVFIDANGDGSGEDSLLAP